MGITSFYFLIFYGITLIFYYILPHKFQWGVLLVASIFYYLCSGNAILIFYPVFAIAICSFGIRIMARTQEENNIYPEKEKWMQKRRKAALLFVIIANVSLLILLKYINFGINTVNGVLGLFGSWGNMISRLDWLVPLGISYYSLSLIGYVTDVYFGIAKPLKNPAKLALYGMFFPVMVSGPILRFREDGEQLFEPHAFNYQQVTWGVQRMLWGFFKELVISERMAIIVNTIYGDYKSYPGIYIWIGTVAFAFQLYTNFSGGMDIALGVAQTFGIKLPENFDRPFFSKTISEYWRRWHITLGIWMKEYIFYPVLRSSLFARLGKDMRRKFGKKKGKQFTTFVGMFILWFTVGIWHGGDWKYIIGSGLLHWFYIVCGELLAPWFAKGMKKLKINPKAGWMDAIRILRTFLLVNIGFVFFRADSVGMALQMLKEAVCVFNPKALLNGGIFQLGLDWIEFTVAIVSLILVLFVSICQSRGSVREQIEAKPFLIRWIIWYALLFYVILLGYYGPGFSAAEFIYQGF
ncbi:hypothetical protein BEI60_15380 [Eisenbergiella tayi]|nr:hypothetical protein BEI60_15380 [Eisenbergiella tayi]